MEPVDSQAKPCKTGDRLFKTTKTSTIPLLTDLRKKLGYGNAGQDQDIAFKRAVRKEIEVFVSSDNLRAYKFTKWKTTSHQRGLVEITRHFLDTKGKGPEFWPDSSETVLERPLQYSKDFARIRRLMIQVFWRSAREYKRYTSTSSTTTPLLSHYSEPQNQPVKSENNLGDTDHRFLDSTQDLRGQSVNNPIDLEDMQFNARVSGAAMDNDQYTGVGMSFEFTTFEPQEDAQSERQSSELQSSAPVISDTSGSGSSTQASDATNNSQLVRGEGIQGTNPYDVPDDPSRAVHSAQDRGKRPAEPTSDDNDHRAKTPRQEQTNAGDTAQPAKSTTAGGKAKKNAKPTRASSRPKKPPFRPEYDSYARKGQRAKGKTNDSTATASTSRTGNTRNQGNNNQGQPSTDVVARAARAAEMATEAAAAAVEEQANASSGLAAARGSMTATSSNQALATRAGPSREREAMLVRAARQGASTARMDNTQVLGQNNESPEGYIHLTGLQTEAVEASRITFRSDVADGIHNDKWYPSAPIFQMSLQAVVTELGLGPGYGTLHLLLETPSEENPLFPDEIREEDEDGFKWFKKDCLKRITNEYRMAASIPAAERQGLDYSIRFSKTPFSKRSGQT